MPLGLRRPGSVLRGSDSLRAGSDGGVFVPPNQASFAAASVPPYSGIHIRRFEATDVAALPAAGGSHSRRASEFSFVVPPAFQLGAGTAVVDGGAHTRRVGNYTFVPPQTYRYAEAAVPPQAGIHTRRGDAFTFGETSRHRGDASVPTREPGLHTRRGDGYSFVPEPSFGFAAAALPGIDPGAHTRRASAYTRVTIQGFGEPTGLGVPQAFGVRRPASLEASALGVPVARGRRSAHDVVAVGTAAYTGRARLAAVAALGVPETTGWRSTGPEAAALGVPWSHGAPARGPEAAAVGTSSGVGSRETGSVALEAVGVGDASLGATDGPAAVGVGAAEADGERRFRRRYLLPGWVKIRGRLDEEWSSEPPPLPPVVPEVALRADSAWYGPFANYYSSGDEFYPGDGYGSQMLRLDDTTMLFIYRHSGASARWTPPADSPYYTGGVRQETPICARRLTFDPASGTVSSSAEVTLIGHPLVDGAGGNDDPTRAWITNPANWSAFLVSTTPGIDRVALRFDDDQGFYDPYPGRQVLFNGSVRDDWGYTSAGIMVFTIDWATATATKGPFNRIGGPVGAKEEYWGGTIETAGLPYEDVYYKNPTEFDYWGTNIGGDVLILVGMLSPTRGITVYAHTWQSSQLMASTFDIAGDAVSFLGTYDIGTSLALDRLVAAPAKVVVATPSAPVFVNKVWNAGVSAYQLRWWSFAVAPDGAISLVGASLSGGRWPNYDGELPASAIGPERVVFAQNDESVGYTNALAVAHVPPDAAPSFVPLLSSVDLAHPETVVSPGTPEASGYSEALVLGSDGAGHWLATWASRFAQSPWEEHLYARGGHIGPDDTTTVSDPLRLSELGTSYVYDWEWAGCWMGADRLAYNYLTDRAGAYSVRTVVTEID